jgi:hypothetical protein
MTSSMIVGVLSVSFALVWFFVAMMLLRVGQLSARQDAETHRR